MCRLIICTTFLFLLTTKLFAQSTEQEINAGISNLKKSSGSKNRMEALADLA